VYVTDLLNIDSILVYFIESSTTSTSFISSRGSSCSPSCVSSS